jgi:hypothetical protein
MALRLSGCFLAVAAPAVSRIRRIFLLEPQLPTEIDARLGNSTLDGKELCACIFFT